MLQSDLEYNSIGVEFTLASEEEDTVSSIDDIGCTDKYRQLSLSVTYLWT